MLGAKKSFFSSRVQGAKASCLSAFEIPFQILINFSKQLG
jgi:hypothetical protein